MLSQRVAGLQVLEMHVDGFRFDLGSIFTRAHSQWHAVDPLSTTAEPEDPPEPSIAESAAAGPSASSPAASPKPPKPPAPPAAPGARVAGSGSEVRVLDNRGRVVESCPLMAHSFICCCMPAWPLILADRLPVNECAESALHQWQLYPPQMLHSPHARRMLADHQPCICYIKMSCP